MNLRGRFFVPDLDKADLIFARAERLHDAVDSVAGEAEDDLHTLVLEGLDEGLASVHRL